MNAAQLPSRLHHTAYVSGNLERTRAFYEDVIGLPMSAFKAWVDQQHRV